jgi:hypothetical protein
MSKWRTFRPAEKSPIAKTIYMDEPILGKTGLAESLRRIAAAWRAANWDLMLPASVLEAEADLLDPPAQPQQQETL